MRIIVVRHGDRCNSQSKDTCLTSYGEEEAVATGKKLAELSATTGPFHGMFPCAIVSSCYVRTAQTALGIVHGGRNDTFPIYLWDGFNEWSDKKHRARYPPFKLEEMTRLEFLKNVNPANNKKYNVKFQGCKKIPTKPRHVDYTNGESMRALEKRVRANLSLLINWFRQEKLKDPATDKYIETLVIVSHADVNKAISRALLHKKIDDEVLKSVHTATGSFSIYDSSCRPVKTEGTITGDRQVAGRYWTVLGKLGNYDHLDDIRKRRQADRSPRKMKKITPN